MSNKYIFSFAVSLLSVCCFAQTQLYGSADAVAEWYEMKPVVAPEHLDKDDSRFAVGEQVCHVPSDGRCETLADGSVLWTIGYVSDGAVSMSVILSDVTLPDGGSLCVMNATGVECHTVPTTEGKNQPYVGSPRVAGSKIIVQYAGPSAPAPKFTICEVCKGFVDVDSPSVLWSTLKATINASSCELPAACFPAASRERRAVCLLFINNKQTGTGTLINNTLQNHDPLVMTSAHVIGGSAITTCEARFGYEEPLCGNGNNGYHDKQSERITGATLVAYDETSDAAILRLSAAPSVYARPYWCGWSRDKVVNDGVSVIHHAAGKEKKMSQSATASPNSSYMGRSFSGKRFRNNIFWYIARWEKGTTESGSSGSALLNSDMKIIGGLSGGLATCIAPEKDYFWMLDKVWDFASHDYLSVGEVLDPADTGTTNLEALDYLADDGCAMMEKNSYEYDAEYHDDLIVIDASNTSVTQPFDASEQHRTIYGARLFTVDARCADTSAEGPEIKVGVMTSDGVMHSETVASRLLNVFKNYYARDFIFPTPITIAAGKSFRIVVKGEGITESDNLKLASVGTSEGNEALRFENGVWNVIEPEEAIMVGLLYTEGGEPQMLRQRESKLQFARNGDLLFVCGEPISATALYNRGGHAVKTLYAEGRPEQHIDLCGLPTGLYVVRTVAMSGNENSMKIIVR